MSSDEPSEAPPKMVFPRRIRMAPPRFQTARVIMALMLREMGSTYGQSPGGYLWAILSPVGVIAILAMAFGLVVQQPALGTSFVLFYATGYLPFDFVMGLSGVIMGAISYSKPLLAYPRVTWIDSVLARFILNVLTKITVFCIVIAGTLTMVDAHTVLDVRPILIGLAMGAALGMGVGLVNCYLVGIAPVWGRIWGIVSRPLFLASGIVFVVEELPREIRTVLEWNPLAHVIAEVRRGFYPTYYPEFVSYSYCFGVSLAMIAVALLLLRRGYLVSLER